MTSGSAFNLAGSSGMCNREVAHRAPFKRDPDYDKTLKNTPRSFEELTSEQKAKLKAHEIENNGFWDAEFWGWDDDIAPANAAEFDAPETESDESAPSIAASPRKAGAQ